MARKYVKYQIVETGEVKILYQDEKPDIYNKSIKYWGNEELPFLNRFGEIIILEFGEDNG